MSVVQRNADTSQSAGQQKGLPVLFTITIALFLVPREFGFEVGSVLLMPHRIWLMLIAPFVLMRAATQLVHRLGVADWLFFLFAGWMMLSFAVKYDTGYLVESGGITFLETVIPYLLARLTITSPADVVRMAKGWFLIVCALLVVAAAESLGGGLIIHPVLKDITGATLRFNSDFRLGMVRALTVFEHAIMYGAFASCLFGLVWYLERDTFMRVVKAGVIGLATFFSLSSGPILALWLQLFFVTWSWAMTQLGIRVQLVSLTIFATLAFVSAELFTGGRTMTILIELLTFDPHSGWVRIFVNDWAIRQMEGQPLFGLAYEDWGRARWIPFTTIDNFWLWCSLRFGYPAVAALVACVAWLTVRFAILSDAKDTPPLLRAVAAGSFIFTLTFLLIGYTVHFFGANYLFIFLMLGSLGCVAERARLPARQPRRMQVPRMAGAGT